MATRRKRRNSRKISKTAMVAAIRLQQARLAGAKPSTIRKLHTKTQKLLKKYDRTLRMSYLRRLKREERQYPAVYGPTKRYRKAGKQRELALNSRRFKSRGRRRR